MNNKRKKLKNPFKITKTILERFPGLDKRDLGLYGILLPHVEDPMIYESKPIALKAYDFFKKSWKLED